ncbi:MAG TPA: hypothetical protein VFI48_14540 [Hyphomicrobiaceae bacterium]|nr:hypothetical protein [Hyphomicrobiaceae bacterium]
MKQLSVVRCEGRTPHVVEAALGFGRTVKRGLIRGAAVATMLAMYAAASVGSMATSTLGVAGLSSLALTATATPASARRRWRRRGGYWRGGYYRRRRHYGRRGFYYGGAGWPYYRRRRRRGFNLYLNF